MQFSEERAVVSQLDGEFAILETKNNVSCDNCSAKSGCGKVSSIFTFKPKNKLRVYNTLNLQKGDTVIVGMAPNKLLKAAILMYLVPLVFLFFFAMLAKLLIGETAAVVAGIMGLFFGLLLIKHYTQHKFFANYFAPRLRQKIINVDLVI